LALLFSRSLTVLKAKPWSHTASFGKSLRGRTGGIRGEPPGLRTTAAPRARLLHDDATTLAFFDGLILSDDEK
jgi:hypothetical protein